MNDIQFQKPVVKLLKEMSESFTDFQACYRFSEDISLNEVHTHDYYEFYFHISGGRHIHTDTEVFNLVPNAFIIFPPFTLHGMLSEDHLKNYERAFIYVSTNLLDSLSGNLLDFQKILDLVTHGQPCMFTFSPEFHSHCVELIREINSNYTTGGLFSKHLAYTKISELLLSILEKIVDEGTLNRRVPVSSDALVQNIARYVSENYATDISLDSIAARFSTSKSTICHRFSDIYHCSLYQFIQNKRISKARENIAKGRSLTDTAYESGFCDYSSFLRTFTKITKMTPTEYRNQCFNRQKKGFEETL